ncbi:MAG: alkaline phosphatase family protein [Anaerolineae bacterium]|jgi:predicted AlkP superfamily phosphohydrolase/phosphomutase
MKRKVAVFGLDGITFDLLQPWLDEGRLPHLARLIAEGASGPLRSTIPPVSASAWASFATGTNPGKHGLIDFTYPDPVGYKVKVSNSHTRTAPALWNIVSQQRGRVGVVSLPMTYPPEPVNGVMLCSFLTPSADSQYTYPESLKRELLEVLGPFPLHMSEQGRGTDPAQFVQAVKEMETERARTVSYLLRKEPWDLFIYVFETTDNLQHEVWHLLDRTHPRHDPQVAARVMPEILDYYESVDRLLGEMIQQVPEDTLVLVLSDHGFGPFHKFFHINNWLAELGLLKFKRAPLSLLKRVAFRMGVTPINALKWVIRLHLSGMRKNVKRGRGRGMLKRLFLSFADVDWSRTKAFSVGNFGQVYLNSNSLRPHGPVNQDEYEALRDYIAQQALALRDPVDGSPIVRQVYRREDIFQGEHIERLPDLVLHTDRARYVSFGHADFGSNKTLEPSIGQTGHHHMVGVLAMKGPGVRPGLTVDGASILDLAPTILHYLGLDVPDHMDGEVLTRAFCDDFNRTNPVSNAVGTVMHADDDAIYTPDEEEAVIAKLRDMGYVA